MTTTATPTTTTDTNPGYKWVGTRPVRHDGLDKVTGRARFGADLSLPGMLTGAVLRSPHAHARIRSIDTAPATAMEGVKAVVTGADFPMLESEAGEGGEGAVDFRDLCRNIMARDKVLYEGHALAAVAATSRRVALAAVAAIKVDYEVLPHVIDVEEAMAPDAPILHEDMFTRVSSRTREPRDIATGASQTTTGPGCSPERRVVERSSHQAVIKAYTEPHAVGASTLPGRPRSRLSAQGSFMVPPYGQAARMGTIPHQGHPGRDRGRLRGQDHRLHRTGGDVAVAEGRASRQDRHDPG